MATEALVWSSEITPVTPVLKTDSSINQVVEKNILKKSDVFFSGNKLFYSNNPETIKSTMLGSVGKWLAKATMSSNFRFYSWHDNQTGAAVKQWLTINNKGSSTLNVTLRRLKRGNRYCDAQHLAEYLSGVGDTMSIAIPANGWNSFILKENIPNGSVLSVICDVEFSGNAVFYEVVVPQTYSGSVNLTGAAPTQSDGNTEYIRGVANYSVGTFTYPKTFLVSDLIKYTPEHWYFDLLPSKIQDYVPINQRFIDSPEVQNFTDADGAGGLMGGCYATEYYIRIPVKNDTATPRNIVLMMGSSYGNYGVVVNMNNAITPTAAQRPTGSHFDCTDKKMREVIKISNLGYNETHEIHFRMMVPGGSGSAARFVIKIV